MNDVKQKHQQKLIEQKIQEEKEQKEKEYIASVIGEKKYDWRNELEKIEQKTKEEPIADRFVNYEYSWRDKFSEDKKKYFEEGMTSSGTFFTTLPATGDTDLQSISGGDSNSFDPTFSDGIEFGASGDGSGRMGGFNIGVNYLKFSQTPDASNDRSATTIKIDASTYTTVAISAIVGNNSNGGVSPTANLSVFWLSPTGGGILGQIPSNGGSLTDYSFTLPAEARGQDIEIFLYEPDVPEQKTQYIGQSIPSLHPSTWNDEVAGWANGILSKSNPTADDFDFYGGRAWTSMQQQYYHDNWPAGAPGYPAPVSGLTNATTQADRVAIGQAIYNAFGSGSSTRYPLTYGISNIGYQRLTPVNVFVPLDSPEASSFIRTDPMMANLSPQERRQKLKEMLEASDEYVTKMLGPDFPGTGAVPPGEAGDTPGVSVSTPPTYLYPGGLVTSGKVTGLTPIRQVYPSQSQSQPKSKSTSQKINFTHTYDVVTDSGIEKRTMDLSTTVPLDAKGNLINPFGDEKPQTKTQYDEPSSDDSDSSTTTTGLGNDVQRGIANTLVNYPEGLPYSSAARTLGQYANNIYNSGGKDGGTIANPLTSSEVNSIVAKMDPNLVGDFNPSGGKDSATLMVQAAIPKFSDTHVVFGTIPNGGVSISSKGIKIVDPAYQFTSNKMSNIQNAVGDYAAGPLTPVTGPLGLSLFGTNPPQNAPATLVQEIPMSVIKKQNPELYKKLQQYPNFGKKGVNENYSQSISEKRRLKSPQEVLDKIPGYYDGKPAPLGFPETPPPEMVNGMHPDLVDGKKVADRFNRLDPESAKAMPPTGNLHIDKKVAAARKKPK
jgi:hypothetical protein